MRKIPEVFILLESSHPISREMILGILDYVREHGPWNVSLIQGGPGDIRLPDCGEWHGDGIIGRVPSHRVAGEIIAANLPTVLIDPEEVLVAPGRPLARCSTVTCDSAAVGRLAAEYFLDHGFTSFAFVAAKPELDWSRRREQAFCERLAEASFAPAVFPANRLSADTERPRLIRWMKKLPPSTALLAANDLRGRDILKAALLAGIAVPDTLSVLGVNDDTIACETSQPRLTSIRMDSRRAGYVAAKMLHRLLKRKNIPRRVAFFSPLEVVERESTDLPNNGDAVVTGALRIIRDSAAQGLRIGEIADRLAVSTRTLETHMNAAGIPLKKEVERRRLSAVDHLVRETDLPFSEIAHRGGFATLPHMFTVYKRNFGRTPGEARKG